MNENVGRAAVNNSLINPNASQLLPPCFQMIVREWAQIGRQGVTKRFQIDYPLQVPENESKRLVLGPEIVSERRLGGYLWLYNRVLKASLRLKPISKPF